MATGDLHKNFVKIGPALPETCSQTDRHTHRQTDHNTPLPLYRGGLINYRTNKQHKQYTYTDTKIQHHDRDVSSTTLRDSLSEELIK